VWSWLGKAIPFARQLGVAVLYKGTPVGEARMDLVIDGKLIVELKETEGPSPLHLAQVLSYLSASSAVRLSLSLFEGGAMP
jgi:GxxExxY protein